jgi:N-acetylglutamate synthase
VAALTDLQLETVRLTEERLVNVWPSVSTLLMDGWVVRIAHGYSGRANSASAVIPGAGMTDGLISEIERLYREAGLRPSVRVTPLSHPSVETMLLHRGYRIKDESWVMTADLKQVRPRGPEDGRVRIEGAPSRAWLAGVSLRQEPSKRSADHLFAIVGHLRVPAAFASLSAGGEDVGFAMAAVDRGWAEVGSVMLDEAQRGRGLGRSLVSALMDWAARQGAGHAFLQVEITNTVARGTYASLGFQNLCRYRTLIKDGPVRS